MKRYAPKDATHYRLVGHTAYPSGRSEVDVRWFKQDGDEFRVFVTDNEGEYPQWAPLEQRYNVPSAVIPELIPLEPDAVPAPVPVFVPAEGPTYTLVIEIVNRPTKFFVTQNYDQLVDEAEYWGRYGVPTPRAEVRTTLLINGCYAPSEYGDLYHAVKERNGQ